MGEIFSRRRGACGWGLALLASTAFCGCAPVSMQARAGSATASVPALAPVADPLPPASAAPIRAVLADAARRTGLPPAQLTVTSAEAVTWPDGSLGCPQPGMMYTQALVPGLRIRIRAGSESLDYHASERGALVLCPPGRAVDPIPASGRV